MRNPLFHEFHYKKVIEPQYTIPQKKNEFEQVNSYIKNVHNADSLDIFQQNYLARQKNVDRAKWGNNLMNYEINHQKEISDNATNFKNQLTSQNNYPTKTDFPIEDNGKPNMRRGSPPAPQQQYQQYNPQRASAPNIHKIPPSQGYQQQQQSQNAPPSRPYYQQQDNQNGYPAQRQIKSQANLQQQGQFFGGNPQQDEQNYYQNNGQNYQQQNNGYNDNQQYQQRGSDNYYNEQPKQQQARSKDFDNQQYQQNLQQQENQFNQYQQPQGPPSDPYLNQSEQPQQNQNMQEIRSPNPNQQPYDQQQQQQQQQYKPQSQQQINNEIYSSPDILSDKRMRKIYNPLIQRVSAVYEPRYGVQANWDKYDREQFRNWENKEQHYQNIVKSKNFILDQHADYSTGNHEYGTRKILYN